MEVVAADRADVPTCENNTTNYAGPRKKGNSASEYQKKMLSNIFFFLGALYPVAFSRAHGRCLLPTASRRTPVPAAIVFARAHGCSLLSTVFLSRRRERTCPQPSC